MSARVGDKEFGKYKKVVTLRNGSTAIIRPICHNDVDNLLALFHRFSRETIYLRFHHVLTEMSREEAVKYCTINYKNTFALVTTIGEEACEKILALGGYYRFSQKDAAEFAIVVEDKYQRQGIGTYLLKELSAVAKEKGIRFLEGEILVENRDMMQVIKNCGFQVAQVEEEGVNRVVLDLTTYQ